MKVVADKDLLKEKLESTIKKLQGRSNVDKTKTMFVVGYGAMISALTTILIGLSSYISSYAKYFSIAALITSATVTVIQAWDKLFNHKKLWIIEVNILRELKDLKEDIEHLERTNNLNQDCINECYERYRNIIKKWNSEWQEMRISE